ncbi:cell surface protein [Colletotrichum musicola]|uniref:Cell surface protein n=1 Tax=Colletotrichum musicola TaxID=2175873 RepID=A0A8H6JJY8_9PEZI|nr:cell surface protein [Colletotrichum musicola]
MSGIVNKVKEALHSDKKHEVPEGTSGPHGSRAANAADPRVDSDRDHRANPATGTTGTTGTSGLTGSHGTTGTSGLTGSNARTGYDDPAGTHGPHSSRAANQADPRVDSDRDHRGAPGSGLTGSHGTTGTSGLTGSHDTTGTSGLTGSHGTTGTSGLTGSNARTGYDDPAGTHGPHSSRAANQADPRVDSDRDHRGAPGSGLTGSHGTTGTSGLTGSHGTSGTSGAHTGVGKVGAAVGGTHGTGPAPNTAGPHKSDALNKADPRVDSDLDGSKTVGGNKTYAQSNTTGVAKDPTDAAQVPPSVLAKHIGEPEIAHGDHGHDRVRRNSKVSAQDLHRGL